MSAILKDVITGLARLFDVGRALVQRRVRRLVGHEACDAQFDRAPTQIHLDGFTIEISSSGVAIVPPLHLDDDGIEQRIDDRTTCAKVHEMERFMMNPPDPKRPRKSRGRSTMKTRKTRVIHWLRLRFDREYLVRHCVDRAIAQIGEDLGEAFDVTFDCLNDASARRELEAQGRLDDSAVGAVSGKCSTGRLPHSSLPEWKIGTCLGAGYFCQITGFSNVMFDLHDGTRIRLLLDRREVGALLKALQATLDAPLAKVNLPHWVISSLMPRSPGSSEPGQSQVPPEISSIATMGEGYPDG